MTTPYERTLSLRRARELLSELSSGTANIEAIQRKAAAILKHYPNDMDIEIAARQAPTVFATKLFDADS